MSTDRDGSCALANTPYTLEDLTLPYSIDVFENVSGGQCQCQGSDTDQDVCISLWHHQTLGTKISDPLEPTLALRRRGRGREWRVRDRDRGGEGREWRVRDREGKGRDRERKGRKENKKKTKQRIRRKNMYKKDKRWSEEKGRWKGRKGKKELNRKQLECRRNKGRVIKARGQKRHLKLVRKEVVHEGGREGGSVSRVGAGYSG